MVADKRVSCFIVGLVANSRGGGCVLGAFPLASWSWDQFTSSLSEDWGDLLRLRDFHRDHY